MDRVKEDLEELILPSGYKFNPTDSELILYYLKNKILGQQLPANIIPTFDVYSCSPDQLPLCEFKYGVPNEWYFFSNRRKGEIATQCGCYVLSFLEPIFDRSGVVGSVRTLDFYYGCPPQGTKSEWSIEEFSANSDFIKVKEDDHTQITDFVVCRVIRKQCDSISSQVLCES